MKPLYYLLEEMGLLLKETAVPVGEKAKAAQSSSSILLEPVLTPSQTESQKRVSDAVAEILKTFQVAAKAGKKPRTRLHQGLLGRQLEAFKQRPIAEILHESQAVVLHHLSQDSADSETLDQIVVLLEEGSLYASLVEATKQFERTLSCANVSGVSVAFSDESLMNYSVSQQFKAFFSSYLVEINLITQQIMTLTQQLAAKQKEITEGDAIEKDLETSVDLLVKQTDLLRRKSRDIRYKIAPRAVELFQSVGAVIHREMAQNLRALSDQSYYYKSSVKDFASRETGIIPLNRQEAFFLQCVQQFHRHQEGESAERACWMGFMLAESLQGCRIQVSVESHFKHHFLVVLTDEKGKEYAVDPLLDPSFAWDLDEYLGHVNPPLKQSTLKASEKADPIEEHSFLSRERCWGEPLTPGAFKMIVSGDLIQSCRTSVGKNNVSQADSSELDGFLGSISPSDSESSGSFAFLPSSRSSSKEEGSHSRPIPIFPKVMLAHKERHPPVIAEGNDEVTPG